MRHILVEITCRCCAYHTDVKSHTLLKPQLEPTLKDRILQGTMFTYECPRCHSIVSFIHSFLYHDSERRLLIAMALSDKTINTLREQLPDSQLYTVKNPQQLSEAVKAAEDRLAIESIELLKKQLKKQDNEIQEVIYHDYDYENQMLWFTCRYKNHEEYKAVPYTAYEQIKQKGRDR